jgi:hypothetical protein
VLPFSYSLNLAETYLYIAMARVFLAATAALLQVVRPNKLTSNILTCRIVF